MNKRKFKVSGMSCAACSARVERAVSVIDGVEKCEVSLLLGEMTVIGNSEDGVIISAVESAGYGAEPYNQSNNQDGYDIDKKHKKQIEGIVKRLTLSSALLVALMYISMGYVMWGFPLPSFIAGRPFVLGIAELILTSLIMVINKHFFVNGVKGIVNLAPNMDTLVALGSSVSYIYSIVLLFGIGREVGVNNVAMAQHMLHGLYFESASMILVLITVGKLLETLAKGKTTSAIRSLMDLAPKTARVIRDGQEVEIPIRNVERGDVFVVKRGDSIPCDGRIIEGEISVNESALTGESLPKDITGGGLVFGATNVLSGWAKVEAVKVGEETAIAEIIKMVKEASSSKAPVAKAADKIAGIFVPSVLIISIVTFALWMLFGAEASVAISHAVTVLVISCPCALGLATPVAIMVGSGVGARHGILFKNAAALEASGRIKIVAFDKTGTVTEGKPEVNEIVSYSISENRLISLAAAIEEKSEHPLAHAIVTLAREKSLIGINVCEKIEAFVGGVSGKIDGEKYFLGNEKFINEKTGLLPPSDFERLKREGKTALLLASATEVLGVIGISDKIKKDSAQAIAQLNSLGIKTVMITGDNRFAAQDVASRVGISEVISEVLPAEKATKIKSLSKHGCVAMVGDGINDSVALTEADVGIAIGRGADVAIDSADVVLTRGSLLGVSAAVRLGRRVLLNVYENLFWAFSYNIIGIPLAAGAFVKLLGWSLTPMFGAASMSISSFLVVVNALRLNFYNPSKKPKNDNDCLQNMCYTSVKSDENAKTEDEKENKIENKTENKAENEKGKDMKTITIKIEGMMCPHCSGRVKAALEASEVVFAADVSHERGDAVITLSEGTDESSLPLLKDIINDAGYQAI